MQGVIAARAPVTFAAIPFYRSSLTDPVRQSNKSSHRTTKARPPQRAWLWLGQAAAAAAELHLIPPPAHPCASNDTQVSRHVSRHVSQRARDFVHGRLLVIIRHHHHVVPREARARQERVL